MSSPRRPDCPRWCTSPHAKPDSSHFASLDLIEHLDDSDCLIEINVRVKGDEKQVLLLFTDLDGSESHATLTPEAADILGYVGSRFDRRGAREVSQLLSIAAEMLNE